MAHTGSGAKRALTLATSELPLECPPPFACPRDLCDMVRKAGVRPCARVFAAELLVWHASADALSLGSRACVTQRALPSPYIFNTPRPVLAVFCSLSFPLPLRSLILPYQGMSSCSVTSITKPPLRISVDQDALEIVSFVCVLFYHRCGSLVRGRKKHTRECCNPTAKAIGAILKRSRDGATRRQQQWTS